MQPSSTSVAHQCRSNPCEFCGRSLTSPPSVTFPAGDIVPVQPVYVWVNLRFGGDADA